MRLEQEPRISVNLSYSDIASINAALENALTHPDSALREADFNEPANPRRLQLALEKLATLPKPLKVEAEEQEKGHNG